MNATTSRNSIFIRHIAVPQDHGSWVFILSPLLIGLFAGGVFTFSSLLLIVASMAAFLIRQPIIIAIKVYSGRRSRRDLRAAWVWIIIYGFIGLIALSGLIYMGYVFLLFLLIPGLLVFVWHLYLVSRRQERRKIGIEIVASGVLALAAPAAMWVGLGYPAREGWLLFMLVWLQSAASIVYAYLRLNQRILPGPPDLNTRLQMGRRSLLYTSFNLVFVIVCAYLKFVPYLLPLAYGIQWLETLWGALAKPAFGEKPTRIGMRQLTVSTLFTIFFIFAWNI